MQEASHFHSYYSQLNSDGYRWLKEPLWGEGFHEYYYSQMEVVSEKFIFSSFDKIQKATQQSFFGRWVLQDVNDHSMKASAFIVPSGSRIQSCYVILASDVFHRFQQSDIEGLLALFVTALYLSSDVQIVRIFPASSTTILPALFSSCAKVRSLWLTHSGKAFFQKEVGFYLKTSEVELVSWKETLYHELALKKLGYLKKHLDRAKKNKPQKTSKSRFWSLFLR